MKNIKSLSLFAIALVAVFGGVGFTNAQVSGGGGGTVTCPAGYVCTPVIPPAPPATTTPPFPVPTSDATVRVIGSPTLELTYNANQSESALTGIFNLSVTAGRSDLYLYTDMASVGLLDTNGKQAPASVNVDIAAGEKSDKYGRNYTQVAAGNTVSMVVTLTASPKQLFAGSYHGFLYNLFMFGSDVDHLANLTVPSNHTNEKVIIGELSPYITGFGSIQPFTPGQLIVVQGQRLDTTGGVFIDGVFITSGVKGDSSNIGFALPASLANGYHTLQIKSNTTGASNNVSFQVQSSVTPCYTFTVNLQIGSTGPDVSALQKFLTSKGFSTEVSGYFGKSTYSALMSYQTSVGIPATGFLGPLTRAEVNASCVSTYPVGNNLSLSLDVTSPSSSTVQVTDKVNGWYVNLPILVFDLKTPTSTQALINNINVQFSTSGENGSIINADLYRGGRMIQSSSVVNSVASFTGPLDAIFTNSTVPFVVKISVIGITPGSRLTVTPSVAGVSAQDQHGNAMGVTGVANGNSITVTNGSTNLPPSIVGGTFPVSLKVNETGTWTVKASDPENGPLSYSVDWGDQPTTVPCLPGRICEMTKKIVQTSSFTHSYLTAGTYTVKFTVQDNAGQTAQTDSTVRVGSVITQPLITSIEPLIASVGSVVTLHGTGLYLGNAWDEVWVSFGDSLDTTIHPTTVYYDGTTIVFTVPSLPSGSYNVAVEGKGKRSNYVPFTINTPTTQPLTASSISFVNGQSTYTSGQQIKVSVKGIASDGSSPGSEKGFNVQAYMQDAYSGVIVQVNGVNQGFNATYNTSTKYWDIAMTAPSDASKSYVIAASFYCSNYSSACSQGQVDQRLPFTITSPTPVFCPAGYICTPGTPTTPQPVNCPSGYICTVPSISPNPTKSLTFNTTGLGSTYHVGDSIPIKWSSTGVSNVVIDLYDYKGSTKVRNITTVGASTGAYNWTVPTDISTNNTYTIRISDADQATLRQTSSKIDLVPVLVVPVTVLPWTVATTTVLTGKPLSYTLNWSGGPMDQSWSTFEHFVKSDNPNIMFGDGFWPTPATTQWSGNISTTRTFTVPANTPPGTYKVMVGLYNASRVTTLVAGSGVTVDNQYRYQVGTITVTAPIQQTTSVWDAFKSLFGF